MMMHAQTALNILNPYNSIIAMLLLGGFKPYDC
jgi:hypothetical protein